MPYIPYKRGLMWYNGPVGTNNVVERECCLMQDALRRKLRVMRAERGLTLREAAERTGVDKGTLSMLERGVRRPHDVTLARLAKGYGVPVEDLFEEPNL